ncbi:MAG TPA: cytochrome c oxidase subunit II [Pyrinomonadaceae bacterium]|jgi:cytochrome c oxidase subunit 2
MGRALAILIWLLTLGSVGLFFAGWWFPPSISEYGPRIDSQFMITIIVVGLAFSAAQIGLGYTLWRYSDNKSTERATYSHGNNRLEIVWTVITAVIFIGLGVMGQRVWAQLHFQAAPADALKIEVVAQQFQWNFHYPGADNKLGRTRPELISDSSLNFIGLDDQDTNATDDAVVSTLIVPVNRPVELKMRSKDVTHNLWVPQLRIKQDVVPGMNILFHFTANQVGQYEVACAELCGQLHYKMRANMLVLTEQEHAELTALPQAKFQARMTELLKKYPLPPGK